MPSGGEPANCMAMSLTSGIFSLQVILLSRSSWKLHSMYSVANHPEKKLIGASISAFNVYCVCMVLAYRALFYPNLGFSFGPKMPEKR